ASRRHCRIRGAVEGRQRDPAFLGGGPGRLRPPPRSPVLDGRPGRGARGGCEPSVQRLRRACTCTHQGVYKCTLGEWGVVEVGRLPGDRAVPPSDVATL